MNDGRCGDAVRLLAPMAAADIDAVLAIETDVYPFPWTLGNLVDSLAPGYTATLLRAGRAEPLLGYFIALAGVAEMHLLNITVAPAHQRRGHARFMLDALVGDCLHAGARKLWLEVRESNAAARTVYQRLGFRAVGTRPGYYPAPHGRRENAVVMTLDTDSRLAGTDGLD